jgi:hypothetical protein
MKLLNKIEIIVVFFTKFVRVLSLDLEPKLGNIMNSSSSLSAVVCP